MWALWRVMRAAVLNSPVKITGRFAGGVFRARRGLPAANNEWGPLTDLPDYSFLDGRTPRITTLGQKRRLIDQYAVTKQIVTLSAELNQSNRKLKEQQDANAKWRAELERQLPKEKGLKRLI